MNEFLRDRHELIALARCISEKNKKRNKYFLANFAATTNEPYLDNRANYLIEKIYTDERVRDAFDRIAGVCNIKHCEECIVKKYCNHYILTCRENVNEDSLKMVDLFCGAGGLSLGFSEEGFITALANDIEACCVDTYAHNHPETPRDHIIQGDIRILTDNLAALLKNERIDIVVGGPPCQSFSMANRQRIIDDPRNFLYKKYVEIVSDVQPPIFVMENVKGMLKVAEQVKEDFRSVGYETSYHILNAGDFGVPQHRERLIYIGNRIGVDNEDVFRKIHQESETIPHYFLKDALYGLRKLTASHVKNDTETGSLESGHIIEKNVSEDTNEYIDYINQGRKNSVVFNHKARYNNDRDIEIFGRLLPGDDSTNPKIEDIMPYKRRNGIFKDKYFKLDENKMCKTITAHMKFDCNMYIHPSQARGLTPREAARVQSYPDDYFFRGPYTKTYMQIGNSVPPLLGRAIAHVVKEYIDIYNQSR